MPFEHKMADAPFTEIFSLKKLKFRRQNFGDAPSIRFVLFLYSTAVYKISFQSGPIAIKRFLLIEQKDFVWKSRLQYMPIHLCKQAAKVLQGSFQLELPI